jgi:hypothetical protein
LGWVREWGDVITTATSGNLISKSANPYIGVILLEPLPVFISQCFFRKRRNVKFDMYLKVNGTADHFIFVPTLAHKLHEHF